jgi:isopentenyl phosphate kinase
VGEVTKVDATLLRSLVASGYIPVVATVATDESGQALNVNADTAAGEIAAALQAEKLILMTDVPGVLRDKDDVSTKFAELNIKTCRELTQEGIIAGGMIPKVRGRGEGGCKGRPQGVGAWAGVFLNKRIVYAAASGRIVLKLSDVKALAAVGLTR